MQTAPPTLSTSAASGGVAGAAVVVLTWFLGLLHVKLPPDVAAALMVLAAPVIHYLVTRERPSHPAPAPGADVRSTTTQKATS